MTQQVRCPNCDHRMFDTYGVFAGHFSVKCTKCRQLVEINSNTALLPVIEQLTKITSQPRTDTVPQPGRPK